MEHERQRKRARARIVRTVNEVYDKGFGTLYDHEVRQLARRLNLPAPDPLPYRMHRDEVIAHFQKVQKAG